jgi:RNA 2',3'-cyclic 3'-phosphodiesterase
MSTQGSSIGCVEFGCEFSRARTPSRLFFSLFPDPETAGRIGQLARQLRRDHHLKGRPLLAARFHCSLFGFDSPDGVPDRVLAKAREAALLVTASPFRVSFNSVVSFSERADCHPLVLIGDDGVVGLTRLRSSLCSAIRAVGLRSRHSSEFTPHVTLLYDTRRVTEVPIEPIGWTVREIVLVLSLTGQTKYVVQGRWQLE